MSASSPERVLVIDNYDSFAYNLVQYLLELGAEVEVRRNDALGVADVLAMAPSHVVISPGPGTPDEAGISLALVHAVAGRIPLLGVCLGHQCIGQALGGRVVHARQVMHGKTSPISHDTRGVFAALPDPFEATRYHSLVVSPLGLPGCLEVSAWTGAPGSERFEIMGIRHRELALEGVQFHPEAILTQHGHALLANFLGKAHTRLPTRALNAMLDGRTQASVTRPGQAGGG
jgi:anthranilate synthase component 2